MTSSLPPINFSTNATQRTIDEDIIRHYEAAFGPRFRTHWNKAIILVRPNHGMNVEWSNDLQWAKEPENLTDRIARLVTILRKHLETVVNTERRARAIQAIEHAEDSI